MADTDPHRDEDGAYTYRWQGLRRWVRCRKGQEGAHGIEAYVSRYEPGALQAEVRAYRQRFFMVRAWMWLFNINDIAKKAFAWDYHEAKQPPLSSAQAHKGEGMMEEPERPPLWKRAWRGLSHVFGTCWAWVATIPQRLGAGLRPRERTPLLPPRYVSEVKFEQEENQPQQQQLPSQPQLRRTYAQNPLKYFVRNPTLFSLGFSYDYPRGTFEPALGADEKNMDEGWVFEGDVEHLDGLRGQLQPIEIVCEAMRELGVRPKPRRIIPGSSGASFEDCCFFSWKEITKGYRKQAVAWHPDKIVYDHVFKTKIQPAYELLQAIHEAQLLKPGDMVNVPQAEVQQFEQEEDAREENQKELIEIRKGAAADVKMAQESRKRREALQQKNAALAKEIKEEEEERRRRAEEEARYQDEFCSDDEFEDDQSCHSTQSEPVGRYDLHAFNNYVDHNPDVEILDGEEQTLSPRGSPVPFKR